MKCQKCGTECESGAKKCSYCGTKLVTSGYSKGKPGAKNTEKEKKPAQTFEATVQENTSQPKKTPQQTGREDSSTSKKTVENSSIVEKQETYDTETPYIPAPDDIPEIGVYREDEPEPKEYEEPKNTSFQPKEESVINDKKVLSEPETVKPEKPVQEKIINEGSDDSTSGTDTSVTKPNEEQPQKEASMFAVVTNYIKKQLNTPMPDKFEEKRCNTDLNADGFYDDIEGIIDDDDSSLAKSEIYRAIGWVLFGIAIFIFVILWI